MRPDDVINIISGRTAPFDSDCEVRVPVKDEQNRHERTTHRRRTGKKFVDVIAHIVITCLLQPIILRGVCIEYK
jgi:hypothetical protein